MLPVRPVLVFVAISLTACASAPPPSAHAEPRHGQDAQPPQGGHHGHGMPHRFEHADEWSRVFDDPARDAWQKPADVVAAMQLAPGMTAADVGAGTGYFLPYLSRAVGTDGKVMGVDIEPDMVRYMTERASREGLANVHASLAKPDDPGLPSRSVDRILIVDTWHHIQNRQAYAALLAQALTDQGMVFIVDFTQASAHGPPKQHRLPPSVVIDELTGGGLAAQLLPVSLPDQYVVVGRVKR